MSKQSDETRAAIVGHVMTAGHVPGMVDKTDLLRAANLVAVEMERSDGDEVSKKMSPEVAGRLLDAVSGLAVHAGITARGDGEVKEVVAEPKPPGNESEADSKKKADEEVTLADVVKLLGTVSDRLDSTSKRLDSLEKHGDVLNAKHDDEPEDLAADDAKARDDAWRTRRAAERADNAVCDFRNEDKFADFQSRCDAVASLFGQKAARPMAGETLGNFKRRSVRSWQSLSPTYKNADLKVLGVADSVAFNVAVDHILACARAEGQRPTRVPAGYLAERVETKRGNTITRFYGRPQSWMDQFMPRGARVKRMHRLDSEGNIAGVAYQRD